MTDLTERLRRHALTFEDAEAAADRIDQLEGLLRQGWNDNTTAEWYEAAAAALGEQS